MMNRMSPRRRKQQHDVEETQSKEDQGMVEESESPGRRSERVRRGRPWAEQSQHKDDGVAHASGAVEEEHVEEEVEEDEYKETVEEDDEEHLEDEEEIDVDVDGNAVVEEEIIEEIVEDFAIPLYPEDAETIHVSGKGSLTHSGRSVRDYIRSGYTGIGNNSYDGPTPRLSDDPNPFSGGHRRSGIFRNMYHHPPPPPVRPPVQLRTDDSLVGAHQRLLPVAVARQPSTMQYNSSYGYKTTYKISPKTVSGPRPAVTWKDEQRRKLELLDIYDSLPGDKQASFLNYLHDAGESLFPARPSGSPTQMSQRVRRVAGGSCERASYQTLERVRVAGSSADMRPQTVEVPAHVALASQEGQELLISPQPDGRAKIIAMMPVNEEEASKMRSDKVGPTPKKQRRVEEITEETVEGETEMDTSDMPKLEADTEALQKKKQRMSTGDEDMEQEWEPVEDADDIDVENVEESMLSGKEIKHEVPMLMNQIRRRQGLFFVPELDGSFDSFDRPICAPRMKGGLRLCESCNVYMRKSIYYHHQRTIREHGSCSAMTPRRFECGLPGCEERLPTIERLCVHMAQEHGMPTDVQEIEFENEEEFQAFLVELESKGGNFRMSRGNKSSKTGIIRYYRCNRVCNSANRFKADIIHDSESHMSKDDVYDMSGKGGPRFAPKNPPIRTERICTAFYRKAELIDGRISVRYCDFHLHDDVRVKLPEAVKDRICNMLKKKLPMPVIVEVIKAEADRFAPTGSELERRIYNATEKDVRNVYCTFLAKRRKEEQEGLRDRDKDEEEENEPFTTMEQRFLTAFEKAEGMGVHDVARGNKITLERRRRRDALRERLTNVTRFFKTERFIECSDAQLATLEELFSEMAEVCHFPPPKPRPVVQVIEEVHEIEVEERIRREVMEEDIEEEDEDTSMPQLEKLNNMLAKGLATSISTDDSMEMVQETIESSQEFLLTPRSEKGRGRGRPKKTAEEKEREERVEKVVKEESADDYSSPRQPIRTSSGRISKPKVLLGE